MAFFLLNHNLIIRKKTHATFNNHMFYIIKK